MEVELGLKLTKSCLDEFASADLRIAKARSGPLFISRETEIMFILTAHLQGYRREQIKIEINEDGSRIVISGERAVEEMMMVVGWKMCKKEIEMRGFRKAFKIPNGVILDKIKARLDDESMLIVFMPKAIKGMRGDAIEEVKDFPEMNQKEEAESEAKDEQKDLPERQEIKGKLERIDKEVEEDEQKKEETRISAEKTQGCEASKCDQMEKEEAVDEEEESPSPETTSEEGKKLRDQSTQTDAPTKSKKKLCSPAIAGSALLVSLLVFVMHLIRTNNKPGGNNKKH